MQTNKGQPLAQTMPCSRFDDARIASGEAWRFRDLRPKAATDIGNVRDAQEFLGHSSETTTAGIYRRRRGKTAKPVRFFARAKNKRGFHFWKPRSIWCC